MKLVGTANIGQAVREGGSGYTLLESGRGSEDQAALTIGYYQVGRCVLYYQVTPMSTLGSAFSIPQEGGVEGYLRGGGLRGRIPCAS